jgi:hypothetical protein
VFDLLGVNQILAAPKNIATATLYYQNLIGHVPQRICFPVLNYLKIVLKYSTEEMFAAGSSFQAETGGVEKFGSAFIRIPASEA